MKLRRRLQNAALSLVAGTVLSVGLIGCEKNEDAESTEVKKTTQTEHPNAEHPTKEEAAKKKPKDHPAH